jgi:hypothetical protein
MATGGPEKRTAGRLFTHIENAKKKYFVCLSERRTPIMYFYGIITLQILRNINYWIYAFKNIHKYVLIFSSKS